MGHMSGLEFTYLPHNAYLLQAMQCVMLAISFHYRDGINVYIPTPTSPWSI